MNKLFLSLFASFMLGKLTSLTVKTHKGEIEKDSLSGVLNSANEVFDFLHITSIQAFDIIDLGKGFEGSSHILNYLITYTPIFFVVLIGLGFIKLIINKLRVQKVKVDSVKKDNNYFKNQVDQMKKDMEKEIVEKEKSEVKAKIQREKEVFSPYRPNIILRFVLGKDYSEFA